LQKAYSNCNLKPKHILHTEHTLDVVIGQSASILKLLANKDKSLLVRGNSCKQKKSQHHHQCDFQALDTSSSDVYIGA
jgi:hypothetical protein